MTVFGGLASDTATIYLSDVYKLSKANRQFVFGLSLLRRYLIQIGPSLTPGLLRGGPSAARALLGRTGSHYGP
jgi:hypothetical protein